MRQIFPKEFLEVTVEVHQFRHSSKSRIIYTLLLLAILITLSILPLINVSIYTSARGILKPYGNRTSITLINSGKVIESRLKNNLRVDAGDTLMVLDNSDINEKLSLLNFQLNETKKFIYDLDILTNSYNSNNLKSVKYQKEAQLFKQKKEDFKNRELQAKQTFDRKTLLFKKAVIAKVEYESSKYDYNAAKSKTANFAANQISLWQSDLTNFDERLKELITEQNQAFQNKNNYTILAPNSGTLFYTEGFETGTYVNQGAKVAEISPDTELVVECFINPSDIGLINPNNDVTFQIDTFN